MSGEPFELYFTEVKAGWLESRVVLNGFHYEISTQCTFSEPLKDLSRCLCDLHGLEALPESDDEPRHFEFEWGGEGWIYFWKIVPHPGGELAVTVEFKGKREVGGQEYPVWRIDFLTQWETMAEQVFTQGSELLWMYGFSGYHEHWTKDFPAGWMMRLGHLLHGQPAESTDFSRELGYLAETR